MVKALGYDVDVHGFRTSIKMWTQERIDTTRSVSEAALAQAVKDMAEVAVARFEKRQKLMERWAIFLHETLAKIEGVA